MKKLMSIYAIILMIITVHMHCIYGMEKVIDQAGHVPTISNLVTLEDACIYKILNFLADTTSASNSLISFEQILKKQMRPYMRVRRVCKKFNRILTGKIINSFYKPIAESEKKYMNDTLIKLIKSWQENQRYSYDYINVPVSILIHKGADIKNIDILSLLEKAVEKNDIELTQLLFNHTHIYMTTSYQFILLSVAKTIEMAQVLIDNKIDIHEKNSFGKNILYRIIECNYPFELVEFYINHNVKVTTTLNRDSSCLLHILAQECSINDIVKKATLLLKYMPFDVINKKNNNGQTPLDLIQKRLQELHKMKKEQSIGFYSNRLSQKDYKTSVKALEELITLFKKHEALTAQELAKVRKSIKKNDENCIIS